MPERKLFIVAIACTIGIGMMTLDSHFKMAFGDILCLLCAMICGIYLIFNERFVKRDDIDAFQMGVFELGFAGILFAESAFIVEDPVLPRSGKVWGCVLFLTLVSTGFTFIAVHSTAVYGSEPCGSRVYAGAGMVRDRCLFSTS